MSKTILIIGGYGNTGRLTTALLLDHLPACQLIIAGRNLDKAKAFAAQYPNQPDVRYIDVANPQSFAKGIEGVDLIINASSTLEYTEQILEVLLQHPVDYLDSHLSSPEKINILKRNRLAIQAAGFKYITDGGFHPGVPAALIRYGALELEELHRANVYGVLKMDWASVVASDNTWKEFIHEFKDYQMHTYRDGSWKRWSAWKTKTIDFGPPFNRQNCFPMNLEELKMVVEQLPDLKETGFFVSGFNPVLDYVVMPLLLLGVHALPTNRYGPLVRLLKWGFSFGKPPFGVKLLMDGFGKKDGKMVHTQVSVAHEDGYLSHGRSNGRYGQTMA